MYEIFEKLCKMRNITPYRFCKEMEVNSSTISTWKKKKSLASPELAKKVCEYFGITYDYLMTGTTGNDICSPCPDCGMWYDANDPEDVNSHQINHASWKKATEKFGQLCCNYAENERIKGENRAISHNMSLPLTERIDAQIKVLWCLFSRSVDGCGYDLRHVPFDTYISMMLGNEAYVSNNLEDDLKQALLDKYGTLPGISSGSMYHVPEEKITSITKKDERDIKKDLENLREKLANKELGPAAFDGEDIPEDDTDLFLGQVELMLRRLKTKNKEKYNPHKNKK